MDNCIVITREGIEKLKGKVPSLFIAYLKPRISQDEVSSRSLKDNLKRKFNIKEGVAQFVLSCFEKVDFKELKAKYDSYNQKTSYSSNRSYLSDIHRLLPPGNYKDDT